MNSALQAALSGGGAAANLRRTKNKTDDDDDDGSSSSSRPSANPFAGGGIAAAAAMAAAKKTTTTKPSTTTTSESSSSIADPRRGRQPPNPLAGGGGGIAAAAAMAAAKKVQATTTSDGAAGGGEAASASNRADDDNNNETGKEADKVDNDDDDPALKDDPRYMKYFKMLKMGLPLAAVKHSLTKDGKDPAIMDLDPNKSLKHQKPPDGPPLKDDPMYIKYFKMLKMGMPIAAVQHALTRDGKDPSIASLDPNKSLRSQQPDEIAAAFDGAAAGADDGPPLKDDPEYSKYYKMIKLGLPMGAIEHALKRDGKDPSIAEMDFERSLQSQQKKKKKQQQLPDIKLKDDPDFFKYFKMLKMGMPEGAVKHAMLRDGKDPTILDLNPNQSLVKQRPPAPIPELKDTGVPLKNDPEYTKYFKMLKIGMPPGAVQNALQRDGKDPTILDMNPEQSVEYQLAKRKAQLLRPGLGATAAAAMAAAAATKAKKKPKVRRKKIYWTPLDPSKLHADSIWTMVKGSVNMDMLKFDHAEFQNLFTESLDDAAAKKKKKQASSDDGDGNNKKKKQVQIIDGKRVMNGGIILARLKMDYKKISDTVDNMYGTRFDAVQLKALKEFLPTEDERSGLENYINAPIPKRSTPPPPPAPSSPEEEDDDNNNDDEKENEKKKKDEEEEEELSHEEEVKLERKSALSECEKYMVQMMVVEKAEDKFDAMLFKVTFRNRLEEMLDGISTVKEACDQVHYSERFRKLIATILTLVNFINTGGDENKASSGFSLDALTKLSEAKAFDKKTSVLHYLVKILRQNDPSLLKVREEMTAVPRATGVILDALASDMEGLDTELELVYETARTEAERLEKDGRLQKMTLAELSEQRTEVRRLNGVQHWNKIDHKTGRTLMERFTLMAKNRVEFALHGIRALQEEYSELLNYFGEDPKMPSNDFFGVLQKFLLDLERAAADVQKAEEVRKREEAKAKKKANSLRSRLAGGGGGGNKKNKKGASGGVSASAPPSSLQSAETEQKRDSEVAAAVVQGVGALAAAAAAKAREEAEKAKPVKKGVIPRKQSKIGSLAAAAAAAAAEKKKKTNTDTVQPPTSAILEAAMAAAKKKNQQQKQKQQQQQQSGDAITNNTDITTTTTNIMGGSSNTTKPSQPTDLAALAAGVSKQTKKETGSGSRGIAAMAALAAKNHPTTTTASEESTAGSEVGIAAMAAAAAARKARNEGKIANKDSQPKGGIAAMAAAAAASKGKSTDKEPTVPPRGGIAALAAAAASKKEKETQQLEKEKQKSEEEAKKKAEEQEAALGTVPSAPAIKGNEDGGSNEANGSEEEKKAESAVESEMKKNDKVEKSTTASITTETTSAGTTTGIESGAGENGEDNKTTASDFDTKKIVADANKGDKETEKAKKEQVSEQSKDESPDNALPVEEVSAEQEFGKDDPVPGVAETESAAATAAKSDTATTKISTSDNTKGKTIAEKANAAVKANPKASASSSRPVSRGAPEGRIATLARQASRSETPGKTRSTTPGKSRSVGRIATLAKQASAKQTSTRASATKQGVTAAKKPTTPRATTPTATRRKSTTTPTTPKEGSRRWGFGRR